MTLKKIMLFNQANENGFISVGINVKYHPMPLIAVENMMGCNAASLRHPKAPRQTEILLPLQKSLWLASSETIAALWTNKSPQSVEMAGYFRKPIQCQICSFYHIFIIADDVIILPDQLTIQIFDEPTLSLLSFGHSLFIMVDDDHLHKTSYSADFQNWGLALNFGKLVNQAPRPKTNAISLWCSFPKLRACPQFWKSG